MDEGLCRSSGIDFMASDAATVAAACQLCTTCPVKATCLAYAVRDDSCRGVWAGYYFGSCRRARRRVQAKARAMLDAA